MPLLVCCIPVDIGLIRQGDFIDNVFTMNACDQFRFGLHVLKRSFHPALILLNSPDDFESH